MIIRHAVQLRRQIVDKHYLLCLLLWLCQVDGARERLLEASCEFRRLCHVVVHTQKLSRVFLFYTDSCRGHFPPFNYSPPSVVFSGSAVLKLCNKINASKRAWILSVEPWHGLRALMRAPKADSFAPLLLAGSRNWLSRSALCITRRRPACIMLFVCCFLEQPAHTITFLRSHNRRSAGWAQLRRRLSDAPFFARW